MVRKTQQQNKNNTKICDKMDRNEKPKKKKIMGKCMRPNYFVNTHARQNNFAKFMQRKFSFSFLALSHRESSIFHLFYSFSVHLNRTKLKSTHYLTWFILIRKENWCGERAKQKKKKIMTSNGTNFATFSLETICAVRLMVLLLFFEWKKTMLYSEYKNRLI